MRYRRRRFGGRRVFARRGRVGRRRRGYRVGLRM